jgi:hypothetical protein
MPEMRLMEGTVQVFSCPAGDYSCMNCQVQAIPSGGCINTADGRSRSVSCDSDKEGDVTCAYLVWFSDAACQHPSNLHYPVCGSCTRWDNETTYTEIVCDTTSNYLRVNKGCDPGCFSCTDRDAVDVAPNQCTSGYLPPPHATEFHAYLRGFVPCHTVTVNEYTVPGCDHSYWEWEYEASTASCQFQGMYRCRPHVVTAQNCSCATCAATTSLETMCTRDPYGKFRTYQCDNQPQTCASMLYFSDKSCTQLRPFGYATLVCQSCQKRPNYHSDAEEFLFVECDAAGQNVYIYSGCDPRCTTCTNWNYGEHPYMACGTDPEGGSALNQGLQPCDSVQLSVYNDSSCSGSPFAEIRVSQNDCNFLREYLTCDANPMPKPTWWQQITMTMCPWGAEACYGPSCRTLITPDGMCSLFPFHNTQGIVSHQMSCDAAESMCVNFALFNDTTCGKFAGVFAPICGTCTQFGVNMEYVHTECDFNTATVTVQLGCAEGCMNCKTVEHHPLMSCVPTTNGRQQSLFNRGLFPCSTITWTHFTSTDCAAGTSIGAFQTTQGICEFDHRYQCGQHTITVEKCSCGATCAAAVVAEGTCTRDAYGKYRQYQCLDNAKSCARLAQFTDAGCKNWNNTFAVVCWTCFKHTTTVGQVEYSFADCNTIDGSLSISTQCDSTCANCVGPTIVHPANACSEDHNGYFYNFGITACDGIQVMVYDDPTCLGNPLERFTRGQHECSFDEYMSCTGNPLLPAPVYNGVDWYHCPQNSQSCMDCTQQTIAAGQCVQTTALANAAGVTMSCNSVESQCADFVIASTPTCTDFKGMHRPVCGSCTNWFSGSEYVHIDCDIFTSTVTISRQCDPLCKSCGQQNSLVHTLLQCSFLQFAGGIYLLNRGLLNCPTVTVTEYTSASCQLGTERAQYALSTQLCQFDHRIECVNIATPPAAPPEGSTGMSAGGAAGVTIAVIAAAAAAGAVFYRFKVRGGGYARASMDNQWNAMSDTPTHTPQGAYGAVN